MATQNEILCLNCLFQHCTGLNLHLNVSHDEGCIGRTCLPTNRHKPGAERKVMIIDHLDQLPEVICGARLQCGVVPIVQPLHICTPTDAAAQPLGQSPICLVQI